MDPDLKEKVDKYLFLTFKPEKIKFIREKCTT
jgi:hypothetical protein